MGTVGSTTGPGEAWAPWPQPARSAQARGVRGRLPCSASGTEVGLHSPGCGRHGARAPPQTRVCPAFALRFLGPDPGLLWSRRQCRAEVASQGFRDASPSTCGRQAGMCGRFPVNSLHFKRHRENALPPGDSARVIGTVTWLLKGTGATTTPAGLLPDLCHQWVRHLPSGMAERARALERQIGVGSNPSPALD